jgi:hypothetical protein
MESVKNMADIIEKQADLNRVTIDGSLNSNQVRYRLMQQMKEAFSNLSAILMKNIHII